MNDITSKCVLTVIEGWLEQLESREGYCGTLRRYHADPLSPARVDTGLTAWYLGEPGIELQNLLEKTSGLGTIWYNFSEKTSSALLSRNQPVLAGVPELEQIRQRAGSTWPDIIIIGIDLAGLVDVASEEAVADLLTVTYHMLEAGGILVVLLDSQSPLASRVLFDFASKKEFDQQVDTSSQCIAFKKEMSIYGAVTIPLANRSSIFDPGSCEDSVVATFRRLDVSAGTRVLDVGVGDGRFSQHILRETIDRGGEYVGLEMARKEEIRPKFPEVMALTLFDTNFFCHDKWEQYDFIFLFFVFHSYKHWPLFLHHAKSLLRPGGRVVFANRNDPIIRWTHGRFFDSEALVPDDLYKETARYWTMRATCGVRSFDQALTIIDRDRCVSAALEIGFVLEETVTVERSRHYCLDRRQLCPGEDEPAMWNIGRVGLTRTDRRTLSKAFTVDKVESTLPENVFVSILRRP